MLNVVLDTNIILSIVSSYSPYCVVKEHLIKGTFGLFVTNDILLEYEEKLQENYSNETAILFTDFLYSLPNLHQVERKFQSELIEKTRTTINLSIVPMQAMSIFWSRTISILTG
ncbi:hypothetical protein EMGBS15_14840 [Filimonas sp.]|nr:hypothetical protein EMGBS15_14840 [Filimonas sp.]